MSAPVQSLAAVPRDLDALADPHLAHVFARRVRDFVVGLKPWPRRFFAIAAGALSVLALAPFFLWPVMFLTLPVLVWLIDMADGNWRRVFGAGWLFGLGYFAAGLFWIGEAFLVEAEKFAWLLPIAVTALPAGLALFWGLATLATERLSKPGLSRVLMLAVALASADWLRGHVLTGFPWNAIGYTLTSSDALMQSAALVGVYSLSFWAVLIFAAPLVQLARREPVISAVAPSAMLLALAFAFGLWRLSQPLPPDVVGVAVRIVQPSVPQREKWLPEKQGEIFNLHLDLSRQNASGTKDDLKGVTHVIWPEAAMPFRPLDSPEALAAISGLLGTQSYLITGALRAAPLASENNAIKVYNSLLAFGPGGGLSALYDKIHLVPFGEYLPWQSTLEAIGLRQLTQMRGGLASGPPPRQPLSIPGLPPASALICYEAIFPGEAIQSVDRPSIFINVTNDGWFGNTTGPRQHFHQTRVRAVEHGVPVLRAANNGISAVIDARGQTRHFLGMDARGVIDSGLPAEISQTPFGRFGSWLFFFHGLGFLLVGMVFRRQ